MSKTKGCKHITEDFIDKYKDIVERLAAVGTTDGEIAFVLGKCEMTINNRFREELDRGRANLRVALRKAQFDAAVNDKNPTMLIWLGKNYLGQKEPRHDIKHTGDITFQKVIYDSTEIIEEDDKNTLLLA